MSIATSVVGQDWAEALRSAFPVDARITARSAGGALFIRVQWWLETDALRSRRKSRPLVIVAPDDLPQRYLELPPERQRAARERLVNWVRLKLKKFNPDEFSPWYGRPPLERWVLSQEDLDPG